MTINHLNLTVTDVAKAVKFFETYFEFTCEQTKGDNVVAVLNNDKNFVLVLMSSQMNQKGSSTYPDAFHIGFMLDSIDKVNETYQRLKTAGIVEEQEPKKIRNSFGFYFHFETLMIEVGHYF